MKSTKLSTEEQIKLTRLTTDSLFEYSQELYDDTKNMGWDYMDLIGEVISSGFNNYEVGQIMRLIHNNNFLKCVKK